MHSYGLCMSCMSSRPSYLANEFGYRFFGLLSGRLVCVDRSCYSLRSIESCNAWTYHHVPWRQQAHICCDGVGTSRQTCSIIHICHVSGLVLGIGSLLSFLQYPLHHMDTSPTTSYTGHLQFVMLTSTSLFACYTWWKQKQRVQRIVRSRSQIWRDQVDADMAEAVMEEKYEAETGKTMA